MDTCIFISTPTLHVRVILSRSPLFVANCSDIMFHSISQTYHFLHKYCIISASVCFYFPHKNNFPPLADWQLCVHASLSPLPSLPVAAASGRPQSDSIRNDFGVRIAPHVGLPQVCRVQPASPYVELQACKIRYLETIRSFDSARDFKMSERDNILIVAAEVN